jgi:nicotinamidase-related amidase
LPVVFVNVARGAPGRTETSLNFNPARRLDRVGSRALEQHPDDHTVRKVQWGAFHGTSLDHFLQRRGVTLVVLTGISTSIGVQSTARNAHDHAIMSR